MAITILHTNTGVFFLALVIEPQRKKFASTKGSNEKTSQRWVRILTSQTSWPHKTNRNPSPPPQPPTPYLYPPLPRHYIVNERLIHNAQKHFTLQMKVPFPATLCAPVGVLTPRWPHQLREKQLIKALTAVIPFPQSSHSLTFSTVETDVPPISLSLRLPFLFLTLGFY